MREELTKVLYPDGKARVLSVLSAEEAEFTPVTPLTFSIGELAAYADELEEDEQGGSDEHIPIHRGLTNLFQQCLSEEQAQMLLYELAAWGGISAYTKNLLKREEVLGRNSKDGEESRDGN